MRTLPMPQVLRAMGLSRRPDLDRGAARDWTLHLTELSASEAATYQLSRHPALALLSTRPPTSKSGPTVHFAPGR
jgi:hypothetical protein